jgi:transcription termination factor Rho
MKVPSLIPDEFAGQGGSILLDPKTGKWTLISRTAPALNPNEPTDALPDEKADNPDQG